jgi:rhodanese-related sulfurtransferase
MGFFQNLFGGGPTVDLKSVIDKGALLVDVREPGEFASGSAKGAINVPLGSISGQIAKFKNKENIIVFCRSGNRSGQAKMILEQNGIKNVVNGGTWQNVSQFV